MKHNYLDIWGSFRKLSSIHKEMPRKTQVIREFSEITEGDFVMFDPNVIDNEYTVSMVTENYIVATSGNTDKILRDSDWFFAYTKDLENE